MKKHHLVVGTIIGGILLAATMQSASTFALSDTSSTTDAPTSDTPTTNSDPATIPADGSIAGGSTADQTDNNSADTTSTTGSSATDNPTPPSTDSSVNPTITNGPSDSQASDPSDTTNSTVTTSGNNTTIDNNINGTSQSGNATVSDNSHGGNATTGDASGMTTLINAIASASDLSGGLQTFTLNLNGTQNGNVLLDPSALLTLAGDAMAGGGSYNSDFQNNSTINNNVNLSATSGDANVSNNRHGGNATSGDAATEADIINLIESLISDQKAFLGVININGTLNGNIILPSSVIDQLLKNNGGSDLNNSNVVATNNMGVNNNISLSAQSGDASVINNDHGGNATSGAATTKLNIYNLINSQIVGGNVLLVFVNVMGNWYGLLMNAPAGTTSAALGGGITQSTMGDGDTSVPADQVFATNNETINNNVTLTSKSGDATISGNHRGGNATTGDASAVADIVNILGSQINLTGWLGILVINVFGTWNGSLQVQPTTIANTGGPNHHGGPIHHTPHHNTGGSYAYYVNYAATFDPAVTTSAAHVLSDHTFNTNFVSDDQPVAVVFDHTKSNSKVMTDAIIAGLAATLAGAAGAARYFSTHRKKGE